MRRPALLLAAAAAATLSSGTPANASVNCPDLGPVPGYGPVCLVECLLGADPHVNPKDLNDTLRSVIVRCQA